MTALRLLIVDPASSSPEDEGVEQLLQGWPGGFLRLRPALGPDYGPTPETGYDFDGIVVMGSASSVHDDLPWRHELAAWLTPLISGSVVRPLLAICYGHQLVAQLAGGEVGPADEAGQKRVGVEDCELRESQLLPGRRRLRCIVSHYDAVTRPPTDFRVVGTRPGLPFDALEHVERPIFTFQGHPEARAGFLEERGLSGTDADQSLVEDCGALVRAFHEQVRS